jgi:hypothetical protein
MDCIEEWSYYYDELYEACFCRLCGATLTISDERYCIDCHVENLEIDN